MRYSLIFLLLLFTTCVEKQPETLFSNVTEDAGIQFSNDLNYTEEINPYTFRNFYNGAGVAIGDINNDGLADIYFAGNQVDNRLFLNQGDFTFEDITDQAGVACKNVWSTGVTMADINGDGLLDIYVCKSGDPNAKNRNNELFINNGDLTFTESAKEYGLDIVGLSVHAAFFDYDKDGDLDCYILTNSFKSVGNYDLVEGQREIYSPTNEGNKFLINNGDRFEDITRKAGIYSSDIGFGLGITLSDFNNDNWTDIFISNDFFERDYLYINNQNGGFEESLTEYFSSISMGSMGADAADLDNDGKNELFVTEMLPDSLSRKKNKTVYENWNKYQLNVKKGYHHQFPRNVLQRNLGDNNYAEISRFSSVAATEWSWGALLFDMNNDGLRDIFVANGIYKDLLDRDYLSYYATDDNIREMIQNKEQVITKLVDNMPQSKFPNYAYKNEGNLTFKVVNNEWGFSETMYSNGSAYGDLDNDGDLDLVLNNINMNAVVYRNNSAQTTNNHSLSLKLSTNTKNKFAVGARVRAYSDNTVFFAENFQTRGFQSTVDPTMIIGVGESKTIDSLVIEWPTNGKQVIYNPQLDTILYIQKDESTLKSLNFNNSTNAIAFNKLIFDDTIKHKGNGLNDFNRNPLLPFMFSNEGPKLSIGDIDGDSIKEFYITGGKDQSSQIIKIDKGVISTKRVAGTERPEERGSLLFDADNDGDLDLYVASGGRFYSETSSLLQDKILINDGEGLFVYKPDALPLVGYKSTSRVQAIDIDNDGDLDLAVGIRFNPFNYGLGGGLHLLENDGTGKFREYTSPLDFEHMVTDISVADINKDGWSDLIVVGDWLPVSIFINNEGKLINSTDKMGLNNSRGWYNVIEKGDLNQDGRPDFIIGNHGLNSFFKEGDRMYLNDFDRNGRIEQIYATNIKGQYYPVVDKDELVSQLPSLKKRVVYYEDYADMNIENLLGGVLPEGTKVFEVDNLSSILLLSSDSPKMYEMLKMPNEAQYAPIYAIAIEDVDGDGILDVLTGGNQFKVKPQFGRLDASHGWFFKGTLKNGKYNLKPGESLDVDGEIRDIKVIDFDGIKYVFIAKYDDEFEVYSMD